MNIEYEATFLNIDKDNIRKRLIEIGAKCKKQEFLQKRYIFNLPHDDSVGQWIRVRDESDKITMSWKQIVGKGMESQKEIELEIDSFENGVEFVKKIGCNLVSYQETKREIWSIDEVEIMIDTWPWLNTFIEIEASTEACVVEVAKMLDFDYEEAIFDSVDYIYSKEYGISREQICNHTPFITFDTVNPFKKK